AMSDSSKAPRPARATTWSGAYRSGCRWAESRSRVEYQRHVQPVEKALYFLLGGRGDETLLQRQHLEDAAPQQILTERCRGSAAHGAEKLHPGRQDDPGIDGQRFDLRGVHNQHARLDEAPVDRLGAVKAATGELPIALGQLRVGRQQMFQVPMQETVLPHGRQQRLEIEGLVLDGQRARRW